MAIRYRVSLPNLVARQYTPGDLPTDLDYEIEEVPEWDLTPEERRELEQTQQADDQPRGDWMDLATITLEPEEIEQEVERYADLDTTKARQVKTALRALEQGRQLVDLREVVKASVRGTRYERTLFPQIALAPYTKVGKTIYCTSTRNTRAGRRIIYSLRQPNMRKVEAPHLYLASDLHKLRWSMEFNNIRATTGQKKAIVPDIPADIEQLAIPGDLILWEAEWEEVAPVDPALLEPLGGSLYLVKAVWDMTPLERALLA